MKEEKLNNYAEKFGYFLWCAMMTIMVLVFAAILLPIIPDFVTFLIEDFKAFWSEVF